MSTGKRMRWTATLAALLCTSVIVAFVISQDQVELQIIVVDSNAQAQKVLSDLNGGADFTKLAQERSTDPTASSGGYLGKQDPSALHLKIRDALKGVRPGQITPIVQLPGGYPIVKMLPPRAAASAMRGYSDPRLPLARPSNVQFVLGLSS